MGRSVVRLVLGGACRFGGWSSKKDEFSTKGKQGNIFFSPNLHACVSVSLLNSLSHVLCM